MSYGVCTSPRHMQGAYIGPRLRSLLSLSLGLLVSVPLRGTTAGHEREALSVLCEALFTVFDVECWVLGGILCCVMRAT